MIPCVIALLVLLAAPSQGGDILSAKAALSSEEVGVGEACQLTVSVTVNGTEEDIDWPEVAGLEAFTVQRNRNVSKSSQTTIINGRITQSEMRIVNFTYSLSASKPGTYPIGPILLRHPSGVRNLGTADIRVVKQEDGLELLPRLSKNSLYVGEQVTFNLRIIPRSGVQSISPPDFQRHLGENFWMKHLDDKIEAHTATIEGRPTRVFDVRIAFFPLQSGRLTLPGVPLEYQEITRTRRRRSGSIFDLFEEEFFAGGSAVTRSATSSPLNLQVKPLPSGAPDGFSGAVGRYTLTARTDKTSLPAGDALTLTITIKGNGQPKAIGRPALPDLPGFEVFEPEETATSSLEGSVLWSTKTFRYVLIPHEEGDFELADIAFPYFDPEAGTYRIATSSPMSISVLRGKEAPIASRLPVAQREISDLGRDIRYIKTSERPLADQSAQVHRRPWAWLLFLIGPLGSTAALVHRRRAMRLHGDQALRRKTKAGASARRRLKLAREAKEHADAKAFYKALDQCVNGYLSDKLNIEFRGLTREGSKELLSKHGFTAKEIQEYDSLMQRCDFGQFASAARDEQTWTRAIDSVENWIRTAEKKL